MEPVQNSDIVYFYGDQIAVVLHTKLDPETLKRQLPTDWPHYKELLQEQLQSGQKTSSVQLQSFGVNEIPHTDPDHPDELASLPGVYVFHTPTVKGIMGTIVAFFHIVTEPSQNSQVGSEVGAGASSTDLIQSVILQLQQNASEINTHPDLISTSTSPHWLLSSVGEIIHGCPVVPPIPVEEPQAEGKWMLSLELSEPELQEATGAGMTVFVLDAFPAPEQVHQAAISAGNKNMLLQTLADGLFAVKTSQKSATTSLTYVDLPASFTTAVTGKDVTGQLVGFPMADHGLCIAGMIRDLVPAANIECIRILNDFGVGDSLALVDALYTIQNRLLRGDLQQGSVVVNLSLVSLPPEGTLSAVGLKAPPFFDPDLAAELRDLLFTPLKSLAGLGVIFVTAAGNDSDVRDTTMNPAGGHFVARYPAQFASEADPVLAAAIIPVGAVNQGGQATSYSNYPGSHGVATCAGDIPTFLPRTPTVDNPSTYMAQMPVDAVCGIYSARHYPILSPGLDLPAQPESPELYPQYAAPNQNSWAYWTGTSFATPIIAALAARVLERQASNGDNIRSSISAAALKEATWQNIQAYAQGGMGSGQSQGSGMEKANLGDMQMPSTQNANVPVIVAHQKWHPAPLLRREATA